MRPITPYHARYFALELRRRGHASGVEAVGTALFDARVDLNPHQIEAALFALQPLRSEKAGETGRLLADEVGLGKTIEAGLVLCQLWAERRRRLLVVCPASLRKQWCAELESKFGLRTRLIEGRHEGNPFEVDAVAVCSYAFARNQVAALTAASWDLVVCDEAHRLRNAWTPESKARPFYDAIRQQPRIFLTATPLQNTLLELYGLVTAVDEKAFADAATFKARYMKGTPDLAELRTRLTPIVFRTLRRDVLAYIRYTERRSMTQRFRSSSAEQDLYDQVSSFLAREELVALPPAQRALATMVLRKLLASSSAAIASGLDTVRKRLERSLEKGGAAEEDVAADFEDEGYDDAWLDSLLDEPEATGARGTERQLRDEIAELNRISGLARRIEVDQRSIALLEALKAGFSEMRRLGAAEKAVIFTESRVTQARLASWLEAHGYAGRVVCFNGTNNDDRSRAILDAWLTRNPDAALPISRGGNSRAANMRAALVDHFEREGALFIATEAGAEGLNLQFASLVVNHDLPWNPQRVEQRIGRCHRYGQKHDVVVVNFLDETNAADRRVLELLTDKFQLFDGVFGVSDDILGAVDGGVAFERRVLDIFQRCRTPSAIEAAFDSLRKELETVIAAREVKARQALFEHFDADVHDRLRSQLDAARARLDKVGRLFWALTRWALVDHARFDDEKRAFELFTAPKPGVPVGHYELVSRAGNCVADAFVYRLSHPLGEHVLDAGAHVPTPSARLVFDASGQRPRVLATEALVGLSGWLRLERLVVHGMQREEHLLFSGVADSDAPGPDPEVLEKLFTLSARVEKASPDSACPEHLVEAAAARARQAALARAAERGEKEFHVARDRLDRWADDQIQAAEVELREVRGLIKQLEREARKAPTLDEQHAIQKRIAETEGRQRRARQHVFTVEDEVREKRNHLLDALERRMAQRSEVEWVFTLAWAVQ